MLFNKIKTGLFIILQITLRLSMVSQTNHHTQIGVGMDQSSTANGHGAFYSPSLIVVRDRNTFAVSPIIQKRSSVMNGIKVAFSRNLSGDASEIAGGGSSDLLQINFFSYLQFNKNLPLANWLVREEKLVMPESQIDFDHLNFSTAEATMGIQLQVNITSNFSWKTYIGSSVYHHINYTYLPDHNKTGLTLCLGTGIQILLPH